MTQPCTRDSGNKTAVSAHASGMGSGGLVVDAMAIGCLVRGERLRRRIFSYCVCVYYCRTYYKAVRGGGRRRVEDTEPFFRAG